VARRAKRVTVFMGIVLQFVVRCETLLKRNPAKGEPMTGDKGVRAEDGWQVPTVVTINLGAGLGAGRWTAGPPDRWTSLQCSKKWAYLSKTGFPIPVHLRI